MMMVSVAVPTIKVVLAQDDVLTDLHMIVGELPHEMDRCLYWDVAVELLSQSPDALFQLWEQTE